MDKSITVVVETSDKVNICVNVILALKLVEGMSEKVRDAVRVALLSEIWKKAAVHGWGTSYCIEIPVKYGELHVDYSFTIFAESAMTVKADVTKETRNILLKIQRVLAYIIRANERQA